MKHHRIVLAACAVYACNDPAPPATTTSTTTAAATPTAAASAQPDAPLASWDLAARKQALQGAHVTPGDSLGAWVAWNVEGDEVTVYDGKVEKTLALRVPSPCEVVLVEKSAVGTRTTTTHFTLKDGAPWMGLGDAGSRRGAEAVACVSNQVLTLDAKGTCLAWDESPFDRGRFESKPATCAFAKDGDAEMFTAMVHGHEQRLIVEGDALFTQQLRDAHSERAADFGAAKKARDAKR
jgi:hypothetical protein